MDPIATSFNCYIVGETSLVIQCANILITQGHRIKGVISPDPQIEAWAFSQHIPWFGSLNLAEDTLVNTSFDYLFSIINNQVLSNIVLNTPQKLAINYHDSPLPRYAGVNATCWSILNDEKHHAITWHMITDLIDGGDISALWTNSGFNNNEIRPETGPLYYSSRFPSDNTEPRIDANLGKYLADGEEYAYLFANGKWVCYDTKDWSETYLQQVEIPVLTTV